MRLLGAFDNDKIDDFWEKWNIHVMKLRGQDTSEIETAENESKRGKRRSR